MQKGLYEFRPEFGLADFNNVGKSSRFVLRVYARQAWCKRPFRPKTGFILVRTHIHGHVQPCQVFSGAVDLSKGFAEVVFNGDFEMVSIQTNEFPSEFVCDIRLKKGLF